MKHLLLFLLAFVDMDSFGQVPDTTWWTRQKINLIRSSQDSANWTSGGSTLTITPGQNGEPDLLTLDIKMRPKYDTLHAVMLVSLSRMGIAHARGGYVVMKGIEVVKYLDCRQREIKQPAVVWSYKLKNK